MKFILGVITGTCILFGIYGYSSLPTSFPAEVPVITNTAGQLNNTQSLPSLAPMIERISPAVVNIATFTTVKRYTNPLLADPFFRQFFNVPDEQFQTEQRAQSAGSGVIIDAQQGYVLTNAHVVRDADDIEVGLKDGRTVVAKLIGKDDEVDLAVLKIEPKDLIAINLATSSEVRVGDFVVAIGNPFSLGQTVTSGIVSAIGRSGLGIEGYEDFIQTDASINPGNSGGALVNLRGELVGINTAIISPAGGNVGIGFAIPTDILINIMNQIIKHGEVKRGIVGIIVQDIDAQLAEAMNLQKTSGVIINRIIEDSPAEKAGLKVSDVVFGIDGKKVRDSRDMSNVLGFKPVGTEINIDVLRDDKVMQVMLVIAEPKNQNIPGQSVSGLFRGVEFSEQVRANATAVVITDINKSSPLLKRGVIKGDILQGVDDYSIHSIDSLRFIMRSADLPLALLILRGSKQYRLVIR